MNKKEQEFVDTVLTYYKKYGRHNLPWRKTKNPYFILVSEIMLQQTQVDRVIPKYQTFIKKWPTSESLAKATLSDVLTVWQGLGYNRRAKYLHECAKKVVQDYNGVFPNNKVSLEALPGIGSYTAGAILAFAYNQPVLMIETNIRTAYLHHFFKDKQSVPDGDILKIIKHTLPPSNTRQWYSALMDYGTHLKQTVGNPNQKSRHYKKQSPFKGSNREIRGAILKSLLTTTTPVDEQTLVQRLSNFEANRVVEQIRKLLDDGLLVQHRRYITLP